MSEPGRITLEGAVVRQDGEIVAEGDFEILVDQVVFDAEPLHEPEDPRFRHYWEDQAKRAFIAIKGRRGRGPAVGIADLHLDDVPMSETVRMDIAVDSPTTDSVPLFVRISGIGRMWGLYLKMVGQALGSRIHGFVSSLSGEAELREHFQAVAPEGGGTAYAFRGGRVLPPDAAQALEVAEAEGYPFLLAEDDGPLRDFLAEVGASDTAIARIVRAWNIWRAESDDDVTDFVPVLSRELTVFAGLETVMGGREQDVAGSLVDVQTRRGGGTRLAAQLGDIEARLAALETERRTRGNEGHDA